MAVRQSEVSKLLTTFESLRFSCDGVDAWSARSLMALFEYDRWENFRNALDRAIEACRTAGKDPERHFIPAAGDLDITDERIFRGVTKKSGRGRPREEMILSRYAAYLVSMNGDTAKEPVAFAQEYFALQTRSMEVLQQRLAEVERLEARRQLSQTEKDLSATLFHHGVDDKGFAIIRSRGDEALFGLPTAEMKRRLQCGSAPLANRLPTVLIRAKDLAAEMTAYNTRQNPATLHGVKAIGDEHVKNNANVRGALLASKITPEAVAADEDTAKVEKRHRREHGSVAAEAQELPRLSSSPQVAAPQKKPKAPTARAMKEWFYANHLLAVEHSPYVDGEYTYGTVCPFEVMPEAFPNATDKLIDKVASELDSDGPWISRAALDAIRSEATSEG